MPRRLTERAEAFARSPDAWDVPHARDAATVMLLRQEERGLSTFLMRRVSSMAFAAGMHVFPGGSVDPDDFATDLPWRQAPADSTRMTADDDLARALVVCAVRELFEETGVLIAVDEQGQTPVPDEDWEKDRLVVQSAAAAFGSVLRRRGLWLDARLLPLWTHWVTPEIESKRFDVRFFATALPEGQSAHDVSGEADHVRWISPAEAMSDYGRGELMMLPPTAATISDFVAFDSLTQALDSAPTRRIRPLLPRPRVGDDDKIVWELIDARDGSVIEGLASEPAGSEVHGVHADQRDIPGAAAGERPA